jgi:hypothetical protein
MLKGFASITSSGLYFKGETFNSSYLRESSIAYGDNFNKKTAIRYDEFYADQIWLYDDFSREWVPAFNTNEETRRLKMAFFEVENLRKEKNLLREITKYENIHQSGEKNLKLNKDIAQAQQEAKAARKGQPKTISKAKLLEHSKIDRIADDIIQADETAESYIKALEKSQKPPAEIQNIDRQRHNDSVLERSTSLWESIDNE